MRTLVKATVTPVIDKIGLKRLRSRLSTVKKNLKSLESIQLKTTNFNWRMNVVNAKKFVALVSEMDNLNYKIEDMIEEVGAYRIQLSAGKYILPNGFEDFTISEGPHNAECFFAVAANGSSDVLRKYIRAHRATGRWIFVHCVHEDVNFVIAISADGEAHIYQE
jgi:hypothetical protein